MTHSITTAISAACLGATLLLGACSSNPLTTSSLFGGPKKSDGVVLPPETANDRLVQVSKTSARASRCGYVFDPATVRSGYLASESAKGTPPDQLATIEKNYDQSVATVAKSIAAAPDYCTDSMTGIIKTDLTKVLAGDYSGPKRHVDVGAFSQEREKLDREKIFNPDPRR